MNRQVSNTDEGSATYKSEVFFFYLGHNMWNNFNRWAAQRSPGEQKLVSLFLLLLPLHPPSALKGPIIGSLLQADSGARHTHIHACMHTHTQPHKQSHCFKLKTQRQNVADTKKKCFLPNVNDQIT